MKILYIAPQDLNWKTAPRVHILEIANNFAKLGHEVDLVYPHTGNQFKREFDNKQINFIPIVSKKNKFLRMIFWELNIISFLKKNSKKYDVIYIRNSSNLISLALRSSDFDVPYFVEINGIGDKEAEGNVIKKFINKLRWKIVDKNLLLNAKGIITVTKELKDYYFEKYDINYNKFKVLSNGVNLKEFEKNDETIKIDNLNIKEDKIVLGFVGNLASWQNLGCVITAIKLSNYSNKLELVIIGDGISRDKLEYKTKDMNNVKFLGYKPKNEISNWIKKFDIGIAPLKDNNRNNSVGASPLKVYEYWACKIPVLASDIPGLELIEKVKGGFNFKADNPQNLAKQIDHLIEKQDEWNKMGMNGRKYVENNATWEIVAKRTLDFIKKVVSGGD